MPEKLAKTPPAPHGRLPSRHCLFKIAIAVLLSGSGVATTGLAGKPAPKPATGTVEGCVYYEADVARPWRFQRYYVKRPKTGELAETVIALRGRELKSAPSPADAGLHTIDQLNYQFVPETTAIRAGESITFTNSDMTTHNVKSAAGIAPFNVNLEADGEYVHRFERAGGMRSPITLGCVYHGGMRAWVYVFDHPFFSVTDESGGFRFEHVPPGRYTLELVHPAGGLRWKDEIVIAADETTNVEIRLSPDQKTLR